MFPQKGILIWFLASKAHRGTGVREERRGKIICVGFNRRLLSLQLLGQLTEKESLVLTTHAFFKKKNKNKKLHSLEKVKIKKVNI